jgi:hypothetical protein
MPAYAQSRAPTRAPILQAQPRNSAAASSNAARAQDAGLDGVTDGSAVATPVVEAPQQSSPARSAGPSTSSPSVASASTAPVPDQAAPPEQQAPVSGLAGPTARLQAGDLAGAANELRQIVSTQRRLLSGGGDRALLQSSLAALAVVESLLSAQQAKEAGKLAEVSRHAQAANGTLSRAPMLEGAARDALQSAIAGFGARVAVPVQDPVPQGPGAGPEGYDAALGQALARASAAISGGKAKAGGRCYARVADAVDAVVGRFLSGGHAYMAASQLAARKNLFTEVSASDLSSLPAGAIVVWGKGTSDSGHISIALGDGRESSDFVGPQMTRHYGGAGARVFLPKARMAR